MAFNVDTMKVDTIKTFPVSVDSVMEEVVIDDPRREEKTDDNTFKELI